MQLDDLDHMLFGPKEPLIRGALAGKPTADLFCSEWRITKRDDPWWHIVVDFTATLAPDTKLQEFSKAVSESGTKYNPRRFARSTKRV